MSSLKWYPRLGIWKTSTGNLRIIPEEGLMYSYRTVVGKKINGTWYLTGAHYSVTTSKHMNELRRWAGYGNAVSLPDGLDFDCSAETWLEKLASLCGTFDRKRTYSRWDPSQIVYLVDAYSQREMPIHGDRPTIETAIFLDHVSGQTIILPAICKGNKFIVKLSKEEQELRERGVAA